MFQIFLKMTFNYSLVFVQFKSSERSHARSKKADWFSWKTKDIETFGGEAENRF